MPKFDIAVLGTGLAGLFTAVQLVKSGKKVVVFDAALTPGGRSVNMCVDGSPVEALSHPVHGLERESVFWRLCADVGIPDIPLRPATGYQVVLPRRRITIYPSAEETLQELRREFPLEADKTAKIYSYTSAQALKASKSVLTSYLLRNRSAHAFLKSMRISDELLAFFDVQSRMLAGHPVSKLSLHTLCFLLTKQPRAPLGGYSWLAKRLCDRFVAMGGELRLEVPWPRIIHRSKKARGLETNGEFLETRSIVLNAVETGNERRLLLHLKSGIIPEEMKDAVYCLSENTDGSGLFALLLGEQAASGQKRDRVTASAIFTELSAEKTESSAFLDRISTIMPFLSEFVEWVGEDDPGARSYPLDSDSPLNTISVREENRFKRSAFKNLYVFPDSGSAFIGALPASRQLVRQLS